MFYVGLTLTPTMKTNNCPFPLTNLRILIMAMLAAAGFCLSNAAQAQPTISHHMSILRKAGLVIGEKHGLWMWYRRNEESLKDLGKVMSSEL